VLLTFLISIQYANSQDLEPLPVNEYAFVGLTVGLPGILNIVGGFAIDNIGVQADIGLLATDWASYQVTVGYNHSISENHNILIGPTFGYLDISFWGDQTDYWSAGFSTSYSYGWFHIDGGVLFGFDDVTRTLPKINIGGIYRID
jgi:hypothetical protein